MFRNIFVMIYLLSEIREAENVIRVVHQNVGTPPSLARPIQALRPFTRLRHRHQPRKEPLF